MRRHASREFPLLPVVFGLAMLFIGPAVSMADEVDIAVDAFAAGGSLVGVSVGSAEKEMVKSLVRCVVSGKTVPDCARDEIIDRLPAQAQPFARCLAVEKKTVGQCAVAGVVPNLPPQARQLAECVAARGDVAQCGKNVAMDQLSQAEQASLRQAFAALDQLKIDEVASNPLTDTPGSVQNIIGVAEGIGEKDWGKVVRYGGREVAKAVAKIVVRTVLPPPVAAALDPAVDALVEQRFDLVEGIITAAWGGDERRLAELYVETFIYTNTPVVMVCALMPSGAIKEAICGLAGKVIAALAGVGGDAAEWTSDRITDGYNGLSDALTGRRQDCGTRDEYYGRNFAACKHHAVLAKHMDSRRYTEIESSLYMACRRDMHPCAKRLIGSTSNRISAICDPIRERFKTEVDELSSTMREAAAAYAGSYSVTLDIGPGEDCDARASQRFFMDCTRALMDQFPDVLRAPQCRPDGDRPLGSAGTLANVCGEAAFVRDRGRLRLNFQAKCARPLFVETGPAVTQMPIPSSIKDKLSPPPAVPQMPIPESVKDKVTRPADATEDPPSSPPLRCTGGMMLNSVGRCACRPGTRWNGRWCVGSPAQSPPTQAGGATPPPVGSGDPSTNPASQQDGPCPRGLYRQNGRCVCPPGREFIRGYCRDIAPKPLACPPGTRMLRPYGRCIPVSTMPAPKPTPTPQPTAERKCPAGSVGRWPRCHRPRPQQPAKCPPGSVGTWPRCGSVVR